MFAVILRSKTKPGAEADPEYAAAGSRMWELAMGEYGCVDASVATQADGTEIFVSYWNSLEEIRRWRHDKEHDETIWKAKDKWLAYYALEVCEIQRAYKFGPVPELASVTFKEQQAGAAARDE